MSNITGLQTSYQLVPSSAYIGELAGAPQWVDSYLNEDSVSIPFGSPVAFKPTPVTDMDARIPAASTDKLLGFLFRSDAYSRAWTDENGTHGELDSTGVTAGSVMNVARKGRIWVTCTSGCSPGDRLFVSWGASGASWITAKGQLGNVTDTDAIDCSHQAQWMSTATAGAGAWLEFDFTNS